ncbi:hypothetical protein KCU73_g998, partial [Aureobasidium melanogenum]
MEGLEDVMFGVTLGARKSVPGLQTVLGLLINTILVRVRVPNQQAVADFVQDVQMRSFGTAPFEYLSARGIRLLEADCAPACEFKHLFITEGTPDPTVMDPTGIFSKDGLDQGSWTDTLTYPLTSTVLDQPSAIQMLRQFQGLVSKISLQGSSIQVSDLTTISAREFEWLSERNLGLVAQEPGVIAISGFLKSVKAAPNAPALTSWDGDMTYGELHETSNRLAAYLQTEYPDKTGLGFVWPVMFHKSCLAIVGILAVLKSGSAYCTIDPALPQSRRQALLDKMGSTLLLCGSSAAQIASVHSSTAACVITQELIDELPGDRQCEALDVKVTDLALILFTSGITGQPKAIEHTQGSLASISRYLVQSYPLTDQSRALHFASYAFDMSHAEIHSALVAGACLCIPSEAERLEALPAMISRTRTNFAMLTPTVLDIFRPSQMPTCQLFSLYGPAEMVVSTSGLIKPGSNPKIVGRGGLNAVWIVEPDCPSRLRPIGATGEILLQSSQLAKGHRDDNAKTDNAFLKNLPWLQHNTFQIDDDAGTSRRFYRTGDMGRLLADGNLEYLGRIDQQVKIHGRRIEMGEIEFHIASAVAGKLDVAVEYTVTCSSKEQPELVAFLGASGLEVTKESRKALVELAEEIETKLADHLPLDMVPRKFIILKDLL